MSKSTQPSLRTRPFPGRPRSAVAAWLVKPLLLMPFMPIVLILGAACGGSEPADTSVGEDLGGMALVGGVALERRGLLVVPIDGGTAELRGLLDPSQVLWRGQRSLPASVDARALGPAVVLRTSDGSVLTYEPALDLVREIGEIEGEPAWTGSDKAGVYYTQDKILVVTGRDGRRITPEGRVSWASPAAGGRVVALVETPTSTRLSIWGDDVEEPEASQTVEAGAPGLVTAWGQHLILSQAESPELVQFGLPDLEPMDRVRLDARPFALAASPSSHRVYAGLEGDAALVFVDRFTGRRGDRGRFRTPVRELRPSTTGDYLLAFDGSTAWRLTPESNDPEELDVVWRSDLPIGLPGGGVLGVREGSVWMSSGTGEEAKPLAAPADAWWLPVSWVPTRARMRLASEVGDPSSGAESGAPAAQGVAGAEEDPIDAPTAQVAVDAGPGGVDAETAAPVVSVPPGFYAIAASSQRVGGVHDLSEALEGDGYPTQVVPRRDEANEIWYRVMVGPYATRDEAEDTLLRLRRERGIQGWVHEVPGEGFGAGDGEAG